jgi:hypothetical protein
MGILRRVKTLEEQCRTSKKTRELIIRLRRFATVPSDLPPIEEQIAQQRKEGKKVIVVRSL